MNIAHYVESFAKKKSSPSLLYDMKTARNLLMGKSESSLIKQEFYENSDYLAHNIKSSVRAYSRNKDIAIHIYKDFLKFLKKESGIEVSVDFPPIAISNTFERLMFIAKYLQDPRHKVSDLTKRLWVSQRTINEDLRRLSGDHEDPIQICAKKFTIEDMEKHRDQVTFASTAHPLFLTPNLTQVLVTLKGLKAMADDPLYAEYAQLAATDIWEQLSDYAKTRIHLVLSELLPEDLTWYESLRKSDEEFFYSEVRCSGSNVVLDCIKNEKSFYVEYKNDNGTTCVYKQCTYVPGSYNGNSIEVKTSSGNVKLILDNVIKSSYTAEEIV